MVILWFFADERSKKQRVFAKFMSKRSVCPICKHEQVENCLEQHCACCLILKGESTIDHSSNTR